MYLWLRKSLPFKLKCFHLKMNKKKVFEGVLCPFLCLPAPHIDQLSPETEFFALKKGKQPP